MSLMRQKQAVITHAVQCASAQQLMGCPTQHQLHQLTAASFCWVSWLVPLPPVHHGVSTACIQPLQGIAASAVGLHPF
jgi:hypothetical protein